MNSFTDFIHEQDIRVSKLREQRKDEKFISKILMLPCSFWHVNPHRDAIPEESQESSMKFLKQGHQMIAVKPSPPTRDKHKNKQSASLLSHNTSSESDSDFEHGKLMRPKKNLSKFTLGESDDETEDKKTWETFIWKSFKLRGQLGV